MLQSLRFSVHYNTLPNQNIVLVGNHDLLGKWDLKKGLRLGYFQNGLWMLEVVFSATLAACPDLEYKYVLVDDSNGAQFWESGPNHLLDLRFSTISNGVAEIRDTFQAGNLPEFTWLDTTLFEDVVFSREEDETIVEVQTVHASEQKIELRLLTQAVEPTQAVYLSGSLPELGQWNPSKAIKLSYIGKSTWALNLKTSIAHFEYKYFIATQASVSHSTADWELGPNRVFLAPVACPFKTKVAQTAEKPSVIISHEIFRRNVNWRASGVAVPVFSLRSKEGLGVGEFLDLIKLVDFCAAIGSRMIQILPVNDTSCFLNWRDSYPYSSLSVFALHPIYMRLQNLTNDKLILEQIEHEASKLNSLAQIDYEKVMAAKNKFFAQIFAIEGKADKKGVDEFVEKNKEWLVPYSVFVHLRDQYKTSDYNTWPKYSKPSRAEVFELYDKLANDPKSSVSLTNWVQYHLHLQLRQASVYASQHRVGLKGDLPIGVNRVSVDSWINHDLFHMTMSTGAPPDQFSEDGQNWGFPTYDWEKMSLDNYAWWRQRLTQMAQYFHAFRIDHILGFFRIWEIPIAHSSGMMGHYNPSIAIHRHQLERQGVWDIRRLIEPYITWDSIARIARLSHDEVRHVIEKFFNTIGHDRYAFKSEYDTDSKIMEYIESLPCDTVAAADWKTKLQKTLSVLHKNVVLLTHPDDPDLFFPRVNFTSTSSYNDLPSEWKSHLYQLYINYFYGHEQEEYWRKIGASRLPLIRSATKMLVCGEDLGMVPKCVEPVMNSLGILGLRVQRMPPDPKVTFGLPQYYSHLTVCTTSSHDTSTIRGWWEEDRAKTAEFYRTILHGEGEVPVYCESWIVENILAQHFHSPSMLAIFPIQDFFAIDESLRVNNPASEKINDPSNPKHYWRYRIHVTLDEILSHSAFVDKLAGMNAASGRS